MEVTNLQQYGGYYNSEYRGYTVVVYLNTAMGVIHTYISKAGLLPEFENMSERIFFLSWFDELGIKENPVEFSRKVTEKFVDQMYPYMEAAQKRLPE